MLDAGAALLHVLSARHVSGALRVGVCREVRPDKREERVRERSRFKAFPRIHACNKRVRLLFLCVSVCVCVDVCHCGLM